MRKFGTVVTIVALLAGLGGVAVASELIFTPLALVNGWVGGAFGTAKPAVAEAFGIIHFRGAMSTSGTNATAFTLPPAFRSLHGQNVYVTVDLCNSNVGRLFIQPSGVTSVQVLTTFAQAKCFTSLEGVSFVQ